MSFEEGFLARWSRRKAEHPLPSGSVNPTAPRDPAPEINPAQGSSREPPTDVECASLEFSSDFSRFVCDGISDALQTAALRRLWLTSPLFGASDGLDVYRADYGSASRLPDACAVAGRALQMVATEQGAADQPTSSLTAMPRPQNEVPPLPAVKKPQPSGPQEPQSNE